jgi:hypothetical protein
MAAILAAAPSDGSETKKRGPFGRAPRGGVGDGETGGQGRIRIRFPIAATRARDRRKIDPERSIRLTARARGAGSEDMDLNLLLDEPGGAGVQFEHRLDTRHLSSVKILFAKFSGAFLVPSGPARRTTKKGPGKGPFAP